MNNLFLMPINYNWVENSVYEYKNFFQSFLPNYGITIFSNSDNVDNVDAANLLFTYLHFNIR